MAKRITAVVLLALVLACGRDDKDRWDEQELGTDTEFEDVFFADSLNGWMTGGSPFVKGGVVARTRDGGDTWEFESGIVRQPSRVSLFHISAVVFFDSLRGCAVGSAGFILRTDDGGGTWRVVRRGGVASHLFDLHFTEGGFGWAVGLGGVLHTEDRGDTWERLDGDPRITAHTVHFVDQWRGWVAGQHGLVMRTGDGGHTWVSVELPLSGGKPFLFDMDFVDDSHGWIVGEHGTVLATGDGGLSWVRQQVPVGSFLAAVSFADTSRGWVVGYTRENGMSQVLHTNDGGATWVVAKIVEGQELRALEILGAHGWAVGRRVRPGSQKLLRLIGSR